MASINALPGLSGYDFSGIVDTMVARYSQPLTQMQTKQSTLQIQKDAWRDINTRLSALQNTLDKLRDAATWAATSASSGDTSVLSVSSASGAVKGSYNVKVVQLAMAQNAVSEVINVEKPSSATALTAGTFTIKVGEQEKSITVSAGESLEKIAEKINNAGAGVSAAVVKVDGGYRLSLISKETGTENAAVFSDVSGNVLRALGVLKADGSLNIVQQAQNAEIEVNGIQQITSSTNTVTTAVPGLTLTLNAADPEKTVVVKVAADYKAAQSAVKAFVDQYNSTISFIEEKLKYNQDTKIKGDLFADPVLQGIYSRLRHMISGTFDNPSETFKILADVGVSTTGDNFGQSGILEFNTAKFNEAMEKDAVSVANLFGAAAGGYSPVTESTDSAKAQGLANILKEYLHPLVMYDGTISKTEKNFEQQIKDLKQRMEEFQEKVVNYNDRLRMRFSLLETQLAALDNQSNWLSAQINSMNAFNSSLNKK